MKAQIKDRPTPPQDDDDTVAGKTAGDDDISIDPVPMDRNADKVGHRGADFAWIPVNRIRVDPVYQRGISVRRVDEIAKGFDIDVFGVVLLSQRGDGSMWCLDGQHRVSAVQTIYGWDSTVRVPCFIMRGLNDAGEARIFYKMNRHRLQPTAADGFKARLAFGDSIAVEISHTLTERGLRLMFYNSGMKFHDVCAIAACEHLHRQGMLTTVLDLIGEAWKGEDGAHKATLMYGIYAFLSVCHDEFFGDKVDAKLRADRRRRLVDTLAELPPTEMHRRARHYQRELNASASNAVARAIHFNFNRGLRGSARLIPWGEEDVPGATE